MLFLALYLTETQGRVVRLTCFFITSVALFVSLSRGGLLAYIAAVSWLLFRHYRSGSGPRLRWSHLGTVLGAIIAIVLVISFTPVGSLIQERFQNLINEGITEESAMVRLVIYSEAALDVLKHPILGTGTGSFRLTSDLPWPDEVVWIGSAPLRILHDTGILGLTAIAGFFVSLWIRVRRGLRSKNAEVGLVVGCFAGALLYSISFELTEGTHLAFFWVFVGLLTSSALFAVRTDATKPLLQSQI